MSKIGFENDILTTVGTLGVNTYGADLLTDGALELWIDANNLTNWPEQLMGTGVGGSLDRSADVHGGTYAAKITNLADDAATYMISQAVGGLSGDYKISGYAKSSGEGTGYVLAYNGTPGTATQIYNFTTLAWEAYAGAGTEDADNYFALHLSSTYTVFALAAITSPASNTICVGLMGDLANTNANSIYFDDITLKLQTTTPSTVTELMVGSEGLNVTQSIQTSGLPKIFNLTAVNNTGGTATQEWTSVFWDFSASKQWETGAITIQREFFIQTCNYTAVAASQMDYAATFYVAGGPAGRSNVNLLNSASVLLDSWVGEADSCHQLVTGIPGIETSQGNVTERSAIMVGGWFNNSLGNQTANIQDIYGIHMVAMNLAASAGTRTITGNVANIYIAGAPTVGANMSYAGTPYSLFIDSGAIRFDDQVQWGAGVAVTAANYSVGRDADATNQLHFNVPTGATFEFSVNDAVEMLLSASAVNFQNNSITTTGGGSLTGTWSNLGTVTTVDINGGTLDAVVIGGASAAAATVTTLGCTKITSTPATITTAGTTDSALSVSQTLNAATGTGGTDNYYGLLLSYTTTNIAGWDGLKNGLTILDDGNEVIELALDGSILLNDATGGLDLSIATGVVQVATQTALNINFGFDNAGTFVPMLLLVNTASQVNQAQITGSAVGGTVTFEAVGSDAAVQLNLKSKGTDGIFFGNSTNIGVLSHTGLAIDKAATFTLSHDTETSDVATSNMIIAAQSALAGASVNQDGGDLILRSGANATGGGTDGSLIFQNAEGTADLWEWGTGGQMSRLNSSGTAQGETQRNNSLIRTTDATVTTITTIATDTNATYTVGVNIAAIKNDGVAQASYVLYASFQNDGGVLSAVGSLTTAHSFEVNAGLDATITASGTNILIRVTGLGATTIDWIADYTVVDVILS